MTPAAKNAERAEPLKAYCRGLPPPLERTSVEPPAARLAALRARPAHRDCRRAEPHPEQWLLIANLVASTKFQGLVAIMKQRWIIARAYLEIKQELGLGHYEGRGRPV